MSDQITFETYRNLAESLKGKDLVQLIANKLEPIWSENYMRSYSPTELTFVDFPAGEFFFFSYLFDINRGRNVVAFGIPKYLKQTRSSRIEDHPLGAPKGLYAKGHLLANNLDGGLDINIIPQLSKVNNGPFKSMEMRLMNLSKKGGHSFYSIRCLYPDNVSQVPQFLEQCVIWPDGRVEYKLHPNM